VVETLYDNRNLVVRTQERYSELRGVRGGLLPFDVVLYDTDSNTVLLHIEADGPHHFNRGFSYGGGVTSGDAHTFEHDFAKEAHVLDLNSSMARLEVRTVFRNKANWKCWLQAKIEAAVEGRLASGIYRLSSSGNHYVTGEYAELRRGTRLDPVRQPSGFEVAKSEVVLVPIARPVVPAQADIRGFFGAGGSSSSDPL
jgi:hypothetical protein